MQRVGDASDDVPMGKDRRADRSTRQDPWAADDSVTTVNPWLVVGFAAVVFVVAVGALVFVLIGRSPEHVDAGGASTSTSTTTTTTPPPTTSATTGSTSVVPQTTAAPDSGVVTQPPPTVQYRSDQDAFVQLGQIIDADTPEVESLVGKWVPQVSSKKPGVDAPDDDRGPYSVADVLSDHIGYRDRYEPQGIRALLLRSDDYNFKTPGMFVTVVDVAFDSAQGANGWCDAQRINADNCFAKQLGHGSWEHTTASRK